MGQLRFVHICMAPSVALPRFAAATMGGVAEQHILHDYLLECSRMTQHPILNPQPTKEEWWDSGNQQHYKMVLLERHKDLNEDKLRRLKTLRVPDISTWGGLYQRNGVPAQTYTNPRNEFYEVKPDSVWGVLAGAEKLRDIRQNMSELALRDYKEGIWYPHPDGPRTVARKEVPIKLMPMVWESLRYRIRRMQRSLANIGLTLNVRDIVLDVERRAPALLFYLVCIKMEIDFQGEEAIAKRIVRRLYDALTTGAERDRIAAEREFAECLKASGHNGAPPSPAPLPIDEAGRRAVRAMEQEEKFGIRAKDIVEELKSSVAQLGEALFTRLRGLPGEQYIVCCDETYFYQQIFPHRYARVQNQLAPLQLRPPVPIQQGAVVGSSIVRVTSPLLATVYVVRKTAQDIIDGTIPSTASIKEDWIRARDWLNQHEAATILIGGAVFYGSALIVASGGATAAVEMYGGALAAEGSASIGALGLQQSSSGLLRSLAGESIARASLPYVEQQVGTRFSIEAARAIAEQEADALVMRELDRLALEETRKLIVRRALKEARKQLVAKALAAGGATIAAVSVSYAVDAAITADVDNRTLISTAAGSLYLLKLRAGADKALPQQVEKFDYKRFSDESPGPAFIVPVEMGGTPRPTELRYLGLVECI
jgi:hypothetical protein